jgi:hypothetical protein
VSMLNEIQEWNLTITQHMSHLEAAPGRPPWNNVVTLCQGGGEGRWWFRDYCSCGAGRRCAWVTITIGELYLIIEEMMYAVCAIKNFLLQIVNYPQSLCCVICACSNVSCLHKHVWASSIDCHIKNYITIFFSLIEVLHPIISLCIIHYHNRSLFCWFHYIHINYSMYYV